MKLAVALNPETNITECSEHWENNFHSQLYTVVASTFELLLPAILLCYLMVSTIRKLKQRDKKSSEYLGLSLRCAVVRKIKSDRLVKIFAVLAITFIVLKLPNNILWLWYEFTERAEQDQFEVLWNICAILWYSSSMVTPLILFQMCSSFRMAVKSICWPGGKKGSFHVISRVVFTDTLPTRSTIIQQDLPSIEGI